ncbi:DDE-type integrase/transposase/recombinase, partial [Leptospira perolatii]
AALVTRLSSIFGVKRTCKLMKISVPLYYRWKNELDCKTSIFSICRKSHPKQITIPEQLVMKSYLNRKIFWNWPLRSIYYRILNDGKAYFNLTTFYKYARILKPQRPVFRKPKQRTGVRANSPFQLLHMDTTILHTTDQTKVFIHIISDNFSRAILGWKVSLASSSNIAKQNLQKVYTTFNLSNKDNVYLLCDGGAENFGFVDQFINLPEIRIRKLIAQVDIKYSNSMVEAIHKKMKYEFLFRIPQRNLKDVIQTLRKAVPEYNHRPSGVLFGYSPWQVLNGAIPDKFRFSYKIKEAASNRTLINSNSLCKSCK